jgi:hypothetical protein
VETFPEPDDFEPEPEISLAQHDPATTSSP